VRGIADPEIMSDLLGDSMTYNTLEETCGKLISSFKLFSITCSSICQFGILSL